MHIWQKHVALARGRMGLCATVVRTSFDDAAQATLRPRAAGSCIADVFSQLRQIGYNERRFGLANTPISEG